MNQNCDVAVLPFLTKSGDRDELKYISFNALSKSTMVLLTESDNTLVPDEGLRLLQLKYLICDPVANN